MASLDELYQSVLGRTPDAGGQQHWQATFGDTIDANEEATWRNAAQVELNNRAPVTTPAATPAATTPTAFGGNPADYESLYTSILGRASDTGGLAHWQQQFGNEIDPYERQTFFDSAQTELQNRLKDPGTNVIDKLYAGYLGRAPDAAGRTHWQEQFGTTFDQADLDMFRTSAQGEVANRRNYYRDIDPAISKILGSSYGQDEKGTYTLGNVNPNKFQLGDAGFTRRDTGAGTYDILNGAGDNLGLGYYDPRTAANQLLQRNAKDAPIEERDSDVYGQSLPDDFYIRVEEGQVINPKYLEGADGTSTEFDHALGKAGLRRDPSYVQPEFGSNNNQTYIGIGKKKEYGYGGDWFDNAERAKQQAWGRAIWGGGQGGQLADWEVLGQALNGVKMAPTAQEWGSLPINQYNEKISGANTLFGSKPIFYDGKLIGYQSDLGTDVPTMSNMGSTDQFQSNPFGYNASHKGRSQSWNTSIGRDIDSAGYKGLVQGLGGSNVFIPKANVDKLPGWTNTESYKHQDTPGNWGVLGQVFDFIDPILDTIDPLHNPVQKATTGKSDTAGQRPYFEKIAPMIVDAFLPGIGTAMSGVNAASKGDMAGLAAAIASYGVGSALNMGGGADAVSGMGPTISNTQALTGTANAGINAGVTSALSGLAGGLAGMAAGSGQKLGDITGSALGGALTAGAVSGLAGTDWYRAADDITQKLSTVGLQGGLGTIKSLISGQDPVEGAISGLASGSLGQLTNYLADSMGVSKSDTKAIGALGQVASALIKAKQGKPK